MRFDEITSLRDLSNFLSIGYRTLTYVLYKSNNREDFYTVFEIPKKNGESRIIYAPKNQLLLVQKKLTKSLYNHKAMRKKRNNISHGFEKERSIITNAERHVGKRYVLNVDLENFFESIHFGRVRGFFNKNKYFKLPIEVATQIAQIVCFKGSLPQGAPTSPVISNLICEILDYKISKISKRYKLHYTRYADDLTFSTNCKEFQIDHEEFMVALSKIIEEAGFRINPNKTRFQFNDSQQTVTGLVVNEKVNVSRAYYKATRSMAHQLYKTGVYYIDGEEKKSINILEGRLNFINQLSRHGQPLQKGGFLHKKLNAREKQYQRFLCYKYFFAHSKPLIITEGKTDIIHLKSALKNLHNEFPQLVKKEDNGKFSFHVSFMNRSFVSEPSSKIPKTELYLGLSEGADTMKNILEFYKKDSKNPIPHMIDFKRLSAKCPINPVVLIYDNERKITGSPILKFINATKTMLNKTLDKSDETLSWHILDNLFLLTLGTSSDEKVREIEDLLHCGTEIPQDKKLIFAQDVSANWKDYDFSKFKPLFQELTDIIINYKRGDKHD